MNVSNASISIKQLLERGRAELVRINAAQETSKVGTLRAGNTGTIALDGQVVGKCARLTYLRMKGIDVETIADNRHLMFEGGVTNEDSWVQVLNAAHEPGLTLKRESEIPVTWFTDNGVPVTGRPDIVLCRTVNFNDADYDYEVAKKYTSEHHPLMTGTVTSYPRPIKGIELKQISSIWTARDVGIKMKPKTMHLLQAAHYSWQLGVPFELWYTSRADFAVGSGWEQRNFPKQGEFGSHLLEYSADGKARKVLPFMQGYELMWTDKGQLQYRPVEGDAWTSTIITVEGIKAYYNTVATMEQTNVLPPCPTNVDADGSKGSYNICDYCPLKEVCKGKEYSSVDSWMAEVLKFLQAKAEKKL